MAAWRHPLPDWPHFEKQRHAMKTNRGWARGVFVENVTVNEGTTVARPLIIALQASRCCVIMICLEDPLPALCELFHAGLPHLCVSLHIPSNA